MHGRHHAQICNFSSCFDIAQAWSWLDSGLHLPTVKCLYHRATLGLGTHSPAGKRWGNGRGTRQGTDMGGTGWTWWCKTVQISILPATLKSTRRNAIRVVLLQRSEALLGETGDDGAACASSALMSRYYEWMIGPTHRQERL